MLAAPADAGSRRELHFHHRRGIGKHAVAEGTDGLLDALAQRLQPMAQQLVIVAPGGSHAAPYTPFRHASPAPAIPAAAAPPPTGRHRRCRPPGTPVRVPSS